MTHLKRLACRGHLPADSIRRVLEIPIGTAQQWSIPCCWLVPFDGSVFRAFLIVLAFPVQDVRGDSQSDTSIDTPLLLRLTRIILRCRNLIAQKSSCFRSCMSNECFLFGEVHFHSSCR